MVFTIFRSTFTRLPSKIIKYRNYKGLNENIFCHELDQTLLKGEIYKSEDPYYKSTEIFEEILQKHAPLTSKQVRDNHAPFMNKELSRIIMNKSRLRNKYLKWPSRENFLAYKKVKNKCNILTRKTKKRCFEYIAKNKNFATNKTFWNTVRPFITNKGAISDENIKIKAEENQYIKIKNKNERKLVSIKTNDCIKDESVLVEMFNEHFINIVEKTSGIAPESLGDFSLSKSDEETVNKILKHYENHPSVSKIKRNQNETLNFDFPTAEVENINKIIKSLNPRKGTGPDGIPVKILKIARNVIDSHLTNIINRDIKENKFLEDAKTTLVRPLYKKNDRDKIQNYRSVSILNGFSKVYERYLLNSLSNHIEKILSNFITAYRKTYNSSHVLIRLTENWKKHLDNKKIVGTVLMDLSKAFDCIPHDLLIAKLHAYGFNKKALTFLYSYLKRRKQSVEINDTESFFQILLSGVPPRIYSWIYSL